MSIAQKSVRWQAKRVGAQIQRVSVPAPAPTAEEVRVRVSACGLNFADTLMLDGRYQERPPEPIVPGMEIAGTVEAIGERVTQVQVGDRVAAFTGFGGLSETVCVPGGNCIHLPASVGLITGATFQVVFGTAHLALWHRAALRSGERLVVSGAAGGTGLAFVKVGASMGAQVIAIARGQEKCAVAVDAGAHHVIDASASDIRDQIKALGGGDVVVDTVGMPLWDDLLRAANPEARLLPLGFAGGSPPQIKANYLMVKNLSIIGFYWGGYRKIDPGLLRQSLEQVLRWISSGALSVEIGAQVPFDRTPEALDLIRHRKATGKVVVTMPE